MILLAVIWEVALRAQVDILRTWMVVSFVVEGGANFAFRVSNVVYGRLPRTTKTRRIA